MVVVPPNQPDKSNATTDAPATLSLAEDKISGAGGKRRRFGPAGLVSPFSGGGGGAPFPLSAGFFGGLSPRGPFGPMMCRGPRCTGSAGPIGPPPRVLARTSRLPAASESTNSHALDLYMTNVRICTVNPPISPRVANLFNPSIMVKILNFFLHKIVNKW